MLQENLSWWPLGPPIFKHTDKSSYPTGIKPVSYFRQSKWDWAKVNGLGLCQCHVIKHSKLCITEKTSLLNDFPFINTEEIVHFQDLNSILVWLEMKIMPGKPDLNADILLNVTYLGWRNVYLHSFHNYQCI